MARSAELWHIGLSPWIIQDGNYKDFHRGQVALFALEFNATSLETVPGGGVSADLLQGSTYRVKAKVVFSTREVLVLDFGVLAYDENSHPHPPGGSLQGEVYLGIDPFFYFESLNKDTRMPPLIYTWRIERIIKESAPLIEGTGWDGRKALVWDESQKTEEEVARTDAWGDDRSRLAPPQSAFHYTLVSTKLEVPPVGRLPASES